MATLADLLADCRSHLDEPTAQEWLPDLAWAAGFFDGEGYFTVRNGNGQVAAIAGIQNTELELLEKFARIVGCGKIRLQRKAGTTDTRGIRATKDCFSWRVYSYEQTQAVGAMLWKFLGKYKRGQFRQVIATTKPLPTPQKHRTKCPHGHPYSPENTYKTKTGQRMCRTCSRERCRRWREGKRA